MSIGLDLLASCWRRAGLDAGGIVLRGRRRPGNARPCPSSAAATNETSCLVMVVFSSLQLDLNETLLIRMRKLQRAKASRPARTGSPGPALTSTQRSAKPPASTSTAGTTVCGMRCDEFERLEHDRHQDSDDDDADPEDQPVRTAEEQPGRLDMRQRRRRQRQQQQRDQQQFDRAGTRRSARMTASIVRFSGGWAPSGCIIAANAPPIRPRGAGRPGKTTVARCTAAAAADSPETRNSAAGWWCSTSGRATIVLSRMPV